MIIGITVFTALATPSTDPLTMLALAGPIWVLYFCATRLSLLNDRRRRQRAAEGPADDEASELDLTPRTSVRSNPVSSVRSLPAPVGADRDRVNGYDDIT